MANRNGAPTFHLDRSVFTLAGVVTLGTTSIASQDCLGFSVARTGTGAYTITLDDKWPQLLDVNVTKLGAAADTYVQVLTEAVASTKTITFGHYTGGGTVAADPASGVKFVISISLRNTSQDRKGA